MSGVEKIKKELDEELEKITSLHWHDEISIVTEGQLMNSPYPERKQLHVSIDYKPYLREKSIRNLKFDLMKISNRLSELLENNVVEDYESYVASFCTYCKAASNSYMVKCLRHHTVSFDLPNVIDLTSNRKREITIRYSFNHVYKPIYIGISKEGWCIELFVYWKHLISTVRRPSGVTFQYNNLSKGKSVYSIAKLFKDNVIDFVKKELGTPYISVTIQ